MTYDEAKELIMRDGYILRCYAGVVLAYDPTATPAEQALRTPMGRMICLPGCKRNRPPCQRRRAPVPK